MKETRSTARQETLLQSTANRHRRRKVSLAIVRSQRVQMLSLEKVTNRQEKLSTTVVRNQPQEVTPQTFRRERETPHRVENFDHGKNFQKAPTGEHSSHLAQGAGGLIT
jgi:hypothetical protein